MGQGQVTHVSAKIEAITKVPVPTIKRELMRFLGMTGYYCKFCHNFSVLTEPCTVLLGKGEIFRGQLPVKKLSINQVNPSIRTSFDGT